MVWGWDVDLEGPLHISELNRANAFFRLKINSSKVCLLYSASKCRGPSKSTSHPQTMIYPVAAAGAKAILVCWLGLRKHRLPRERMHSCTYISVCAAILLEQWLLRLRAPKFRYLRLIPKASTLGNQQAYVCPRLPFFAHSLNVI